MANLYHTCLPFLLQPCTQKSSMTLYDHPLMHILPAVAGSIPGIPGKQVLVNLLQRYFSSYAARYNPLV